MGLLTKATAINFTLLGLAAGLAAGTAWAAASHAALALEKRR